MGEQSKSYHFGEIEEFVIVLKAHPMKLLIYQLILETFKRSVMTYNILKYDIALYNSIKYRPT